VLLFKTEQFDGELVSSEEGEMLWIERESLQSYPIVDDFIELLKVFDNENVNEMMYERRKRENDWIWVMKLY